MICLLFLLRCIVAIRNLEVYLEGIISAIADERGIDSWFNEDYLRTKINERVKEEAWVSLSPTERIWKILEVCKVLSKKHVLTPQKRRVGSIFYAKRAVTLHRLKYNQ